MQQLNGYRFYELGARLHSLFDAARQNAADMFSPLTEAQSLLDGLIKDEKFPLETSRADATRLLNKLGSLFNRYFIDPATKQMKSAPGERSALTPMKWRCCARWWRSSNMPLPPS